MTPQEKMAWIWLALIVSLFYFSADALAVDNTNTNTSTSTVTTTNTSTSDVTSNSTNTTTNNSATTIDHKNQPVGGARAPTVSVTNSDVCVSGVSGGAQSNMLGISFGTTVTDKNCERIKLSRELRKGGMKVASVALLCQDPRVFQAMIMSGTPCPAKGAIGKQAANYWNSYPELRPDFKEYLENKKILIDAGYINEDGSLRTDEQKKEVKDSTFNWNN
jgi:hypothetical protein